MAPKTEINIGDLVVTLDKPPHVGVVVEKEIVILCAGNRTDYRVYWDDGLRLAALEDSIILWKKQLDKYEK